MRLRLHRRLTFALIVLAPFAPSSDGEDCPSHPAGTSPHGQFSEPLRNRAVVCAGAVSTLECAMEGGKFVFCNASNVYTDPKTRAFVMYCNPTALFKDAARWHTLGKYSPLEFIDIRPPQQAVRPVQATADTTLFVSRADCNAPFNQGHCLADLVNTFGVRTAYGVTRASASSLVFTGCRGMEPTSPVFLNYEALARHAHIGHRCLGGTPTTPLFDGVTLLPQVVFGANPWWSVVWKPRYPVSAKLRFDRVCGRWVGERCRYPDELLMAFQREVMRRVDEFQPALDLRGVPTALTHNLDQPTATPPEGLIVLIDRSSYLMDGTKTPTTGCRRCIVDVEDVWRELVATFGSGRPLVAIDFKGLPYALQLRVMSFADTVVGVHGAAVSHVVYMRPNSTLIELLPTDAESRNQNLKMHYEIAASLGVNYRAVQVPRMKWRHGGVVGGARVVEAMRRAWRADGCARLLPAPPSAARPR